MGIAYRGWVPEGRYRCDLCGIAFRVKNDCNSHRRSHESQPRDVDFALLTRNLLLLLSRGESLRDASDALCVSYLLAEGLVT